MKQKQLWAALALLLLIGGGYYLLTAGKDGDGGSGAPMVSVTVPELTVAAERGKVAFDASCASCHGANAAGQEGDMPPVAAVTEEELAAIVLYIRELQRANGID